jgi:hypothetical protein
MPRWRGWRPRDHGTQQGGGPKARQRTADDRTRARLWSKPATRRWLCSYWSCEPERAHVLNRTVILRPVRVQDWPFRPSEYASGLWSPRGNRGGACMIVGIVDRWEKAAARSARAALMIPRRRPARKSAQRRNRLSAPRPSNPLPNSTRVAGSGVGTTPGSSPTARELPPT